jgi:hypothetical protein
MMIERHELTCARRLDELASERCDLALPIGVSAWPPLDGSIYLQCDP